VNSGAILLAEDNPDDVLLISMALKKAGFLNRLLVVSDGEQSLDYLKGEGRFADRTQFPFPELVMLDLKMPRLSGFEVLTWLRQQPQGKDLPVIIITTSCYSADITQAYALGASSFLTKPTVFEHFVAEMKALCDCWLTDAGQEERAIVESPAATPPPLQQAGTKTTELGSPSGG